jgi:hypothetical protein
MKKIYWLFFIFLIFACSNSGQSGEGNIIIRTPDEIHPVMKSIFGTNGNQIDTGSLSQSQYRYEIIVESNGKRISYAQLKNDTEKTISVPSGIPLNFRIGVYCAKDSNSMDELYNVYLASCSKDNVMVMFGESKNLELKLDLNKQQRVDSYYNGNFGISNITGEVWGVDNAGNPGPVFSAYPNNSNGYDGFFYDGTVFTQMLWKYSGKGFISSYISQDYTPYHFWYINKDGIRRASTTSGIGSVSPSLNYQLSDVFKVYDYYVNFNSTGYYYYFLNYYSGLVGLYTTDGNSWTANNVGFSEYDNIYPEEPFLLDSLTVSEGFPSINNILLATKIGSYLISKNTALKLASGDKNGALSEFKKYIRIQNPSSSGNILITKAEYYYNNNIKKTYLGTKQGLFYIDNNSSVWHDFSYNTSNDFLTLSQDAIKIADEFKYNEPIEYMDLISTGASYVLIACTPNRIWFENLGNGKTDMVTVWDGLNFIPNTNYSWKPRMNTVDYKTHNIAQVNSIIFDATNSKFWICTQYGLCSVDINKLNL